jgi:hypothetical protein
MDRAWDSPASAFGVPGPTLLNNHGVDRAIFNALDANKDGYISQSEWERVARKPLRIDVNIPSPPPAWNLGPMASPRQYQCDGHRHTSSHAQYQCDDVLVEVKAELHPQLTPGPNGTFNLEVPCFNVGLHTTCAPATSSIGPTPIYKPYEALPVTMPELTRVVFDPLNNMPRNGQLSCSITKYGDVMEFDSSRSIAAKIKTESPYGKMVVGDHVLHWKLHIGGKIEAMQGVGNGGADRLEVELQFHFDCYMHKEVDGGYVPSSAPSPRFAPRAPAWSSATPPPAWGPSSSVAQQATAWGALPENWMPKQAVAQEPLAMGGRAPTPHGPGMSMQIGRELECFVEVMPTLRPSFERGPGNSYVMMVPRIDLQFTTGCTPQTPLIDNMPAFKPHENVELAMSEISRVIFDPDANVPRDGRLTRTTTTKGCVMEFSPAFSIDAKLKTNSKNGSVHLTHGATGRETVLHWKLHIEGKLFVNKDAGTFGTNRLEGELFVTFECHVCL